MKRKSLSVTKPSIARASSQVRLMVGIPVLTTFFVLALGLIVLQINRQSLLSLETITEESIEASFSTIISAILLVSSLAFVSSAALAMSVTKSMHTLAEHAQNIARGDLVGGASPISIAGNPEFAALGSAFNSMVESLNKQFISGANNGVVLVDSNGLVTFANQNAIDMLGLEHNDIAGKSVLEGPLAGEAFSDIAAVIRETLETKSPARSREVSLQKEFGDASRLRVSTALYRDSRAGDIGISLWIEDITSIIILRQDLQKLESLVTFVSFVESVAHQVRNPLCSIRGHAQLIRERSLRPAENDLSDGIINNVDIIDSVIRAFLDSPDRDMISGEAAEAAVRELRSALIPDLKKGA